MAKDTRARGPSLNELFEQAVRAHRAGRLDSAIEYMRRAISLSPADVALHNNLGGMWLEHGDLDAAARAFRAALAIDPSHHSALFNLGNLEQRRGRTQAAAQCFRDVIKHHGADVDTLNNLASALVELGDAPQAIRLLETSCEEHPHPRSSNNLGLALRAAGRAKEALAAFRRALSMLPDFADAHNNLGNLLLAEGDSSAALTHLRRATELAPKAARFYSNLGNALQSSGNFEEAEANFQRAVAIDPDFTAAKRHLTLISGQRNLQTQIDACSAQLEDTGLPDSDRIELHFALGKLLDASREYDGAFAHYQRGNNLMRKRINFNAEEFSQRNEEVLQCFSGELLSPARTRAHPSPRPVFIVGMPRSGTSLVEQVLASHAQISGAGELPFFADLENRLAEVTDAGPYPGCARALRPEQTLGFAEEYLSLLDHCNRDSRYVLDKLPGNALRLGLIQLVFANARVIYCTREARDLGLSNYFQYFTGHQSFAYDLGEIGAAIRVHERAMAHWRQLDTQPILTVPYERMVTDLEQCTREILAFLDLPFDANCLAFHRTQRTVRTASSWQVRQPLYATSVNRWRNYAGHLAPLTDGLKLRALITAAK